MDRKRILTALVVSGVIMTVGVQPARADNKHWRKGRYHKNTVFSGRGRHHYPARSYGYISFTLPRGFISVAVGGATYHYHEGVYYRKDHHGYVITPPPIGARISHLPRGYTKVYIDGSPQYVYNGVYYERTSRGYVVIEEPGPRYVKIRDTDGPKGHGGHEASFEINIPNKHSGYTTVILQRSGDGFTGPQGEYYEEFPRVDKLKVIYGS